MKWIAVCLWRRKSSIHALVLMAVEERGWRAVRANLSQLEQWSGQNANDGKQGPRKHLRRGVLSPLFCGFQRCYTLVRSYSS